MAIERGHQRQEKYEMSRGQDMPHKRVTVPSFPHQIYGGGRVKRSGCCYHMELTVKMTDIFDFNLPGWPTHLLERYGMAFVFKTYGYHSVDIYWWQGKHDFISTNANDFIQGGGAVVGDNACLYNSW